MYYGGLYLVCAPGPSMPLGLKKRKNYEGSCMQKLMNRWVIYIIA